MTTQLMVRHRCRLRIELNVPDCRLTLVTFHGQSPVRITTDAQLRIARCSSSVTAQERVDGLLHTVMAEESVEIDEIAPQPAMACGARGPDVRHVNTGSVPLFSGRTGATIGKSVVAGPPAPASWQAEAPQPNRGCANDPPDSPRAGRGAPGLR